MAENGERIDLVIRNLIRPEIIDPEHDCSAAQLSGVICQLLGETILTDDSEDSKLDDWLSEIRALRCTIIAEHEWIFDQCGYWGHQYCIGCHAAKYPDLAPLRCSEAKEKVGAITEEEYLNVR